MNNRKQRHPLLILCGVLGLTLTAGSTAMAITPADGVERRNNRQELREDDREIRDDRQDLGELINHIDQWHMATSTGNKAMESTADRNLSRWLNQERRENQVEVQEAKREENQSQREKRRSRRETSRSDNPVKAVDSHHDQRDDRRDHRDDRQDEKQAKYNKQRTNEIAKSLKAMQPDFDRGIATQGQYSQKSGLLRELEGLARMELEESKAEKMEDKAERREDRRELMEPGR